MSSALRVRCHGKCFARQDKLSLGAAGSRRLQANFSSADRRLSPELSNDSLSWSFIIVTILILCFPERELAGQRGKGASAFGSLWALEACLGVDKGALCSQQRRELCSNIANNKWRDQQRHLGGKCFFGLAELT
jgi:hypothetical protein